MYIHVPIPEYTYTQQNMTPANMTKGVSMGRIFRAGESDSLSGKILKDTMVSGITQLIYIYIYWPGVKQVKKCNVFS